MRGGINKMQVSRRASSVRPSLTLSINAKARRMIQEGRKVINLSAGEPDFNTPEPIGRAGIKAIQENFTRYTPVKGSEDLIQSIVEKFKQKNKLNYSPSQIIVANGAKQIIYNAIQAVCNPGDEVIIPTPYWVSYPEQVRLAQAVPVYVSLEFEKELKIDIEELKRAIHPEKTKVIILNSPHNPTGGVFTEEELRKIAEVLEPYPILIISDEIYEDFVYEMPHVSIASLGESIARKTLTVNGVSKTCSMTGWRIGYAGGPEEIIQAMTKIQSHSTSCACSISQKAAVAALNQPEEEIKKRTKEFDKRRKLIKEALKKIKHVKINKPLGAFYIFPDFSYFLGREYSNGVIKNSLDLANYILEKAEVAVVPGSAFGAEGHLRISYAASSEEIKEGMKRIRWALSEL